MVNHCYQTRFIAEAGCMKRKIWDLKLSLLISSQLHLDPHWECPAELAETKCYRPYHAPNKSCHANRIEAIERWSHPFKLYSQALRRSCMFKSTRCGPKAFCNKTLVPRGYTVKSQWARLTVGQTTVTHNHLFRNRVRKPAVSGIFFPSYWPFSEYKYGTTVLPWTAGDGISAPNLLNYHSEAENYPIRPYSDYASVFWWPAFEGFWPGSWSTSRDTMITNFLVSLKRASNYMEQASDNWLPLKKHTWSRAHGIKSSSSVVVAHEEAVRSRLISHGWHLMMTPSNSYGSLSWTSSSSSLGTLSSHLVLDSLTHPHHTQPICIKVPNITRNICFPIWPR